MSDLDHVFGSDLTLGTGGDLGTQSGGMLGQQRVLRRLLTNSGDYIWRLDYGAGLPRLIGTPANAAAIHGLVGSQIFLETAVARNPAPRITVQADESYVFLQISYSDADTSAQTLGITLSA